MVPRARCRPHPRHLPVCLAPARGPLQPGAGQQRAFAQQILAYQEIERKRIAGELHDDLGQRLSVIRNLALLANRTGYGEREGQIQIIADEVSHAIAEVRQISHNLRPYQLDMLGLTKAIEVLVEQEPAMPRGIRFEIVADDLSGAFPKEAEIHFYRVVQECLHNITRHSRATCRHRPHPTHHRRHLAGHLR